MSAKSKKSENEARLFQQEMTILELTELICKLMYEQQVSRTQLAKRLGKTKGYVSQILNGERNMTIRTLSDFLFALNQQLIATSRSMRRQECQDDAEVVRFTMPKVSIDYAISQGVNGNYSADLAS